MEFTNPFTTSRQEKLLLGTGTRATDVTVTEAGSRLLRKPSLRTNFSYPRLSRHEPSESRSSNESMPGMTDASDSDLSFDDDCIYNTSAGELWDSFWPDGTAPSTYRQSQGHHLAVPQSGKHGDYFNASPTRRRISDIDGDTIRVAPREHNTKAESLNSARHTIPTSSSKFEPKIGAVTYSVCPKPPVTNVQRHLHPPRTSSLSFESLSPPRRPLFLRGSKSSAGLKPSKSTHNIHSLFILPSLVPRQKAALSQQQASTIANTTASVPVSPAYPPPPATKMLRLSTSAFNIRDRTRAYNNSNKKPASRNVTAPLTPLLPSALPETLPRRPQMERFVSVFELDSDSETEAVTADESNNSFAKRIARGLHKKSASEKRGFLERKAVTAGFTALSADNPVKDYEEKPGESGSLGRKRGGSLGRIFGLMGR